MCGVEEFANGSLNAGIEAVDDAALVLVDDATSSGGADACLT